jgi:hypothetical protein
VVGGLITASDEYLRAIRIIWMRQENGVLKPDDRYLSPWYSRPLDYKIETLAGNGEHVIGIYGKQGMHRDGVGLVVAR